MAESLAIKNGGGSGLNSETLLWTNPNPGASKEKKIWQKHYA